VFNFFFRTARFLSIGFLTGLALVFIVNNFLDPSLGKTNITILSLTFSFIPLFLALFVEFFFYFQRKSLNKMSFSRNVEHLKIK
jgi:magnesium-transporting ATPase (P-type)